MKTYIIAVPETHYSTYTIEAKNKRDAINQVLEGLISSDNCEFSHIDEDSNNWKIKEDSS